jgi:transglutaminase-like putative cysteine protease
MQLSIHHETLYRYAQPQTYSISVLRLTPPNLPSQQVLNWKVSAPGILRASTDAYGNLVHQMSLSGPHLEVRVVARGEVITQVFDGALPVAQAELYLFAKPTSLTTADANLLRFAQNVLPQGLTRVDQALLLASAIADTVQYLTGSTDVAFSAQEAFALGRGVCQDHAHIFLACARALGCPARYVSGYVNVSDASHIATHAWVDVAVGGQWWPVDVTHRCMQDERHVRLAVGTDYSSASPVRGIRVGQGTERMHAKVLVGAQPGFVQ